MKQCTVCKEDKALTEFYNKKVSKDGKCSRCKECDNKARHKWQTNNPKKAIASQRNRSLKHKYGITTQDYEAMLNKQGGTCAICNSTESKGAGTHNNFSVDHAHDDTKKIRGLLCNRCNGALGMFSDNMELLQKAVEYLNKNEGRYSLKECG